MDNLVIRQELPKDYGKVLKLIKYAFKNVEHSDKNEHYLVENLRKSKEFIPELSIVAELNNEIVGYILFTKVRVGATTQLALAPLTVSPVYQKQGIGGRLINEGHKLAKLMEYEYSIVLGSPLYYSRFGYISAKTYGIECPFDIPEDYYMAKNLQEKTTNLCAVVEYPKEFNM